MNAPPSPSEKALAPCPWCSSKKVHVRGLMLGGMISAVCCGTCCAEGPAESCEADAVGRWNALAFNTEKLVEEWGDAKKERDALRLSLAKVTGEFERTQVASTRWEQLYRGSRETLRKCAKAAGGDASEVASDDFLSLIPGEVESLRAKLTASEARNAALGVDLMTALDQGREAVALSHQYRNERDAMQWDRDNSMTQGAKARALLGDALLFMRNAKHQWAPHTTNSLADDCIASIAAFLTPAAPQAAVLQELEARNAERQ